jgi:cytochrome c oxidase cbb3-type subunit 2
MPAYPFLTRPLDADGIAAELKANRAIGVPYTDEMIAKARADLLSQANADDPDAAEFQKRYPNAAARDFDGDPKRVTELDALVAYLQMLGTLVDFKLYEDRQNLR